jgi:hypothetical protein
MHAGAVCCAVRPGPRISERRFVHAAINKPKHDPNFVCMWFPDGCQIITGAPARNDEKANACECAGANARASTPSDWRFRLRLVSGAQTGEIITWDGVDFRYVTIAQVGSAISFLFF